MEQRRSAPSTFPLMPQQHQLLVENGNSSNRRRSQGATTSSSTSKLAAIFGFARRRDPSQRSLGEAEMADSGNGEELLAGIQALRTTSKLAAKTAEAQRKGAKALAKWAERSNNNAMSDVVGWSSKLFKLCSDKQTQFAKDQDHFLKEFRKLAETEQRIRREERELEKLVERERRLVKQFRQKGGNRLQLDKAAADREKVETDLEDSRAEAEVIKMIHLREGLIGIADAQRNLARAMEQIFACQRELAEFVPAVATKDVRQMRYEGVPLTRQKVEQLQAKLAASELQMPYNAPSSVEQRQRQSEPPLPLPAHSNANSRNPQSQHQRTRRAPERRPQQQQQSHHLVHPLGTPPPPYTPTAPPIELLIDGNSQQQQGSSARHNPNRHSAGALMFLSSSNMPTGIHPAFPITPPPPPSANRVRLTSPPPGNHSRIYPWLPPNPYAVDLLKRSGGRQQQQQTASGGGGRF